MANRKRLTAWLCVSLILFVTLVSGFEIARETHHVCDGAHCRVCAQITLVRELLRNVSLAVVSAFFAAAIRFVRSTAPKPIRGMPADSPVCLRVKLLN